jgi:hypothetical protein
MTVAEIQTEKTYVASIATALSSKGDYLMKRLPKKYQNNSVEKVVNYMVDLKQLNDDEIQTAKSIKREMSGNYTIEVNGNPVKLDASIGDMYEDKEHKGVEYKSLELRVSSVQEGGFFK